MKIGATTPPSVSDRHVQFSEFVDVRLYNPDVVALSSHGIEPSNYAQRLERTLRTAPVGTSLPPPPDKPTPCTKAYKRTCDVLSIAFGVAVLPSFALVIFGLPWLAAPGVLTAAALVCFCFRGKPTAEMEQEYEMRRVAMRLFDSRGA